MERDSKSFVSAAVQIELEALCILHGQSPVRCELEFKWKAPTVEPMIGPRSLLKASIEQKGSQSIHQKKTATSSCAHAKVLSDTSDLSKCRADSEE